MRYLSFFSGIGGFDLGLDRAGHTCVGQVEVDPYCLRVLERHWPDVPRFGDVRTIDPDALPDADIWCGGFPCQPFSVAGARRATDDERDLWPAWFKLIASRRPRWIFGENVPGLLTAEGGATWGRLVRDLASVGYVGEWTVLGARDVGAPHRRDRLWVVAYLADAGRMGHGEDQSVPDSRRGGTPDAGARREVADTGCECVEGRREEAADHRPEVLADTYKRGLEIVGVEEYRRLERASWDQSDGCGARGRRNGATVANAEGLSIGAGLRTDESPGQWRGRPRDLSRPECWCGRGEPWCCDPADVGDTALGGLAVRGGEEEQGDDGHAVRADMQDGDGLSRPTQPFVGRVAHGIPRRVDRLRGLGNAVVPQVVEAIARKVWG